MHPCWNQLGIAPSVDERDIKRAYAKLVKTIRPEDDPVAFQQLREAFEQALWQAGELQQQLLEQPLPDGDDVLAVSDDDLVIATAMRPFIHELARLNESGTSEEALAKLDELLDYYQLRDPAQRNPQVWSLFEDGLLFVCCDIAANHDEFMRRCVDLGDWLNPQHWLSEKDPKTQEWLGLRLQEADALAIVDEMVEALERGDEASAVARLQQAVDDELLLNIDVRQLFEAELMVSLSELDELPQFFVRTVLAHFAWQRDSRHLQDYHPEAWQQLAQKLP